MHNMSDIIEQYIKQLFEESNEDMVEIQKLILLNVSIVCLLNSTMLLKQRFTNEHGYEIESKRGGGGYIRITKLKIKMQRVILIIYCN